MDKKRILAILILASGIGLFGVACSKDSGGDNNSDRTSPILPVSTSRAVRSDTETAAALVRINDAQFTFALELLEADGGTYGKTLLRDMVFDRDSKRFKISYGGSGFEAPVNAGKTFDPCLEDYVNAIVDGEVDSDLVDNCTDKITIKMLTYERIASKRYKDLDGVSRYLNALEAKALFTHVLVAQWRHTVAHRENRKFFAKNPKIMAVVLAGDDVEDSESDEKLYWPENVRTYKLLYDYFMRAHAFKANDKLNMAGLRHPVMYDVFATDEEYAGYIQYLTKESSEVDIGNSLSQKLLQAVYDTETFEDFLKRVKRNGTESLYMKVIKKVKKEFNIEDEV